MGLRNRRRAPGGQPVAALPLAAPDGGRFGEPRSDEPPALEPVERGINRAGGHGASGARFDLVANRHAVGVVAEPDEREQQQALERTGAMRHHYSVGNIDEGRRLEVAARWAGQWGPPNLDARLVR